MDGNGRWAAGRGLPRLEGHRKGAQALRRTVKAAVQCGISYLTVFGFSTENWQRPSTEVEGLMGLLRHYLRSEIEELHKNGVALRVVGDRARFPSDIVALIEQAETLTARNTTITLTIALNYGGRWDIVEAARALARDGGPWTQEALAQHLCMAFAPEPDLLIRTAGERRLSNFLLWDLAYTELYFTDTLWPDFGQKDLETALLDFSGRERRFGGVVEAKA